MYFVRVFLSCVYKSQHYPVYLTGQPLPPAWRAPPLHGERCPPWFRWPPHRTPGPNRPAADQLWAPAQRSPLETRTGRPAAHTTEGERTRFICRQTCAVHATALITPQCDHFQQWFSMWQPDRIPKYFQFPRVKWGGWCSFEANAEAHSMKESSFRRCCRAPRGSAEDDRNQLLGLLFLRS